MSFPVTRDTFTRPNAGVARNAAPTEVNSFSTLMSAVESVEDAIGISGSTVAGTIENRLNLISSFVDFISDTNNNLTLSQISDTNSNRIVQFTPVAVEPDWFQMVESTGNNPGNTFAVRSTRGQSQLLIGVDGEATTNQEITESGPLISLGGNVGGTLNIGLEITPLVGGKNFFRITSETSNANPRISAVGPAANIGMEFRMSGVAEFRILNDLNDRSKVAVFHGVSTSSAVNYLQLNQSTATAKPSLQALGSDTTVGISYQTKGAAVHLFNNAIQSSGSMAAETGTTAQTVIGNVSGIGKAGITFGNTTVLRLLQIDGQTLLLNDIADASGVWLRHKLSSSDIGNGNMGNQEMVFFVNEASSVITIRYRTAAGLAKTVNIAYT